MGPGLVGWKLWEIFHGNIVIPGVSRVRLFHTAKISFGIANRVGLTFVSDIFTIFHELCAYFLNIIRYIYYIHCSKDGSLKDIRDAHLEFFPRRVLYDHQRYFRSYIYSSNSLKKYPAPPSDWVENIREVTLFPSVTMMIFYGSWTCWLELRL